jgi:hypothetical protein
MDTRLHASANIISGLYRTIVRKHVKPDSLEGEDKRRYELLNSIYSEKHYTLDAPKLLKLVDDEASQSVKIMKRRDSLAVCWRSSTATLLSSTSSTAEKPSLPPSLTASTSSRSQTGKTSSFVDTITFPPHTPTFCPRPGAFSPHCRDGLWGSEKECKSKCEKGRCTGSDGSPRFICDCVAPLRPATTPRPSPLPQCKGGGTWIVSQRAKCEKACVEGKCVFKRFTWICQCNWWMPSDPGR